jgi:DNA-binding PadR family transcriptional regulator
MRDNVKGGALTETTFFILLALYEPTHGYGIMQFIDNKTNGRLMLGAGTLYGAINNLLKKGWIAIYDEEKDSRKIKYMITEKGKEVTKKELDRLRLLCNLAGDIMGGKRNE